MEDRETPRMRKYGESKTTRIMMADVPHVTAWAGRTKYQADGFLFDGVYVVTLELCLEAVNIACSYVLRFYEEENVLWKLSHRIVMSV